MERKLISAGLKMEIPLDMKFKLDQGAALLLKMELQ